METTYLKIKIEGEKNLGFIGADIEGVGSPKLLKSRITQFVEPKLVTALGEHFDCEVKVQTCEIVSSPAKNQKPLHVRYNVVICADSEDYVAVVNLKKTWLY